MVTGGAGFIGRWVVKLLLDEGYKVVVLDNLRSGSIENILAFKDDENFMFVEGSILERNRIEALYEEHAFEKCFHLAFLPVTQAAGIDDPERVFENDVLGTFYTLEACRKYGTRLLFMSTSKIYARSNDWAGITEVFPTSPASPYVACRMAGESMALSYWNTYGLPVTVVRPFNTYGSYQRPDGEGGVVTLFLKRRLEGKPLQVYGDGTQTRDMMAVSDCAAFVVQAGTSEKTVGEILNVGSGRDVTINLLAELISGGQVPIEHVSPPHSKDQIHKLLCNYKKARDLLGWRPKVKIERGVRELQQWMENRNL